MLLQSLRLINYRCFEDSGEIPLRQFSVLIGKNDGGKSSALLAIHKLLGGQQFENDDHRKIPAPDEASEPKTAEVMEARVLLRDENGTYHHYRCIRTIDFTNSQVTTANEIECECVDDSDLNQDFESLSLEILKDLCNRKSIATHGPQNRKATFVQALDEYRAALPKKRGWIPAPKAFCDKLPKPFRYAEGSELDPQQTIRSSMSEYYRVTVLPEHRSTLEAARRDVQRRLNEEAVKYVSVLTEHCPDVTGVSVDLAESSFENIQIGPVRITQAGGVPIDWTRIGRGKRREMSLAVFRFSANLLKDALQKQIDSGSEAANVLALFDEPDLNLDYTAQRRVSSILQELGSYSKCQCLVATHSLNLIDNTPLKQICFFTTDEGSSQSIVECFDAGEDSAVLDVLQTSMGIRNSALFNEKLFVICEGPTEIAALPILFTHLTGKSMHLCGIHLINGLDNEEAKRIAKILKKNGRSVHLVLDSDCRSNSKFSDDGLKKAYLDPAAEVAFIGQTEFEDAFSDKVWMELLNRHYGRGGSGEWTPDLLETAHAAKKFSEAMVRAIGIASDHVSKPELGQQLANVAVAIDDVPAELSTLMSALHTRIQED